MSKRLAGIPVLNTTIAGVLEKFLVCKEVTGGKC